MVFVVAEIGVNWDGNFDLAKDMMIHSKKAGCNAVKFQSFDKKIIQDHPQADRLIKSAISKSNVETINELAKQAGIEWFCTPMYPEALEFLDSYIKRYKIRLADARPLLENKETELLKKVLTSGKEIIASTQPSPRDSKYYNDEKIKWLYCVPKYPCDLNDIDFRNINDFNGYSNHCPNYLAPLTATILGAEIIEIHITSDKSKDFFDNNVSFDYKELSYLVKAIHDVEKINK
jgi:N,N'-diacetyllegionaminate synthase